MGKYLSFARYNNLPIFDTMMEWSNWGSSKISLEHLAIALGIPTPKTGIDGSEVGSFSRTARPKKSVTTVFVTLKRLVLCTNELHYSAVRRRLGFKGFIIKKGYKKPQSGFLYPFLLLFHHFNIAVG